MFQENPIQITGNNSLILLVIYLLPLSQASIAEKSY